MVEAGNGVDEENVEIPEPAEDPKPHEEALQRSLDNEQFRSLRLAHLAEKDRFIAFQKKQKWSMWTRQGQEKIDMTNRHAEIEEKLKTKVSLRFDRISEV